MFAALASGTPPTTRSRVWSALHSRAGFARIRHLAGNRPWQGHYPHELRAGYATRLTECGVTVHAIQQRLGHVILATAAQYLAADLDHLRRTIRLPSPTRCSRPIRKFGRALHQGQKLQARELLAALDAYGSQPKAVGPFVQPVLATGCGMHAGDALARHAPGPARGEVDAAALECADTLPFLAA